MKRDHKAIPVWLEHRPHCKICGARISGYLKVGQANLSWRHRNGKTYKYEKELDGTLA